MTERADSLRIKISGVEVVMLTAIGTVPGVVVRAAAAANGPGRGLLRYLDGSLYWQAPGDSDFGLATAVPANGTYLVESLDSSKWLRCQVYFDYLPETAEEARVDLSDRYNGAAGDDVSAAEATAGLVEVHTLTVANESAANISAVHAWLDAAAAAGFALSRDNVTFSAPTTEAAAVDLGDIAASGSASLYVRRTIAAGAAADPEVLEHIHFSFLVAV